MTTYGPDKLTLAQLRELSVLDIHSHLHPRPSYETASMLAKMLDALPDLLTAASENEGLKQEVAGLDALARLRSEIVGELENTVAKLEEDVRRALSGRTGG